MCPVPSLEAAVCSLHFQAVVWRNVQACPYHMPSAVMSTCQSKWQSWLLCLPSLLEKEVTSSHASKVEKTGKAERKNKCQGPLDSSRDPSTGLPVIGSPFPDFCSFYNILKTCRGHTLERSVFSERTEESSAVQYFQVS